VKEIHINQTLKISIRSFVTELDLGVPTTCQLGLLLCLNYNNNNNNKHAYEEDACGYLRAFKNLELKKSNMNNVKCISRYTKIMKRGYA
jgi:hypothetical protein